MKRFYNPLLFLLANLPDAEKNLKLIMNAMQATTESVNNIRNGINNFQVTMHQMATGAYSNNATEKNETPSPQTPEQDPVVKAEPDPYHAGPQYPPEASFTADPTPVIQMPPRPPETDPEPYR